MRRSLSLPVSFNMLKRIHLLIVIFALSSNYVGNAVKTWKGNNPKFMDPDNWAEGYPPCALDKIVFPEEYSASIFLPKTLETAGLILPREGALLIHTESEINFGVERKKDDVCRYKTRQARMKHATTKHWFDPENWNYGENNSAIPHVERIPCSNEEVFIEHVGGLSIDLENAEYLYMGMLELDGDNVPLSTFENFLKTDLGEVMFKNDDETFVKFYDEPICGCHRPDVVTESQLKVCNYKTLLCEVPHCVNPVVPVGHCCPVCGAVLKMHVDNCKDFKIKLFEARVKTAVGANKLENELDVHAAMVEQGYEQFLQLVILEKNGYSEQSTAFMKVLNETLLKVSYGHLKQTFHSSGMAYSGSGASIWVFIFVTLLAVVIFFAVIFVHFVPETPYISIPPWMYPSRYRLAGSPFVFARFENAQPEAQAEEARGTVVMNVTYEEGGAGRSEPGTTSFDNPMFSEKDESEKIQVEVPQEPTTSEEQEMTMTSINLDTAP